MRTLILSVLLSAAAIPVFAFQQIYNFGDVPLEQLEKTVYSIDSTANAIVLFDAGESYLDADLKVHFERHVRIKILTDAGLDQGDVSISYRVADSKQDIKGLEVVSYTLKEDGDIRNNKLGRRDHYTEQINDSWNRLKFSVPGLTAGSVFEYKYEIVSDSPVDINGWKFQQDIPVLWSEYSASIPEWFNFLTLLRSFYPLEINSKETYQSRARYRRPMSTSSQEAMMRAGTLRRNTNDITYIDYQGTKHEWAMKNIPAITAEPYLNSADDYAAKVILQLHSYQFPYAIRESVLSTWLDLIDIVEKSENFGQHIRSYSMLRKTAEESVDEEHSDEEKLIKLYNLVRDRMNWNEEYQFFIKQPLDEVFEQGIGNSSEINMILVQLLRETGIEAYPLILSTRTHGEILDLFPIIDQFNHAIAYASIDDQVYLLDAIHKDKPYYLLSLADLNGSGLVIDPKNPAWMPLNNEDAARYTQSVEINLENDGSFRGVIESKMEGYYAYSYKKYFTGEDSIKKAHDFLFREADQISLTSIQTEDRKAEKSYFYMAQFSGMETLNEDADILYLNPFYINRISENPFAEKERKHPVDFNFPFTRISFIKINLPEGWAVDEAPQSKIVRLPQELGEFRRLVQATETDISIVFSMRINSYKIPSEYYDYLRSLYQELVISMNENIVLTKI